MFILLPFLWKSASYPLIGFAPGVTFRQDRRGVGLPHQKRLQEKNQEGDKVPDQDLAFTKLCGFREKAEG
jgi:hypothetical protein